MHARNVLRIVKREQAEAVLLGVKNVRRLVMNALKVVKAPKKNA
jgi:hypothetical protein